MSENDAHRRVDLRRVEHARFEVTNVRGGRMTIGEGKSDEFTPVELLLAGIAGCSAIDVDYLTARRAEPTSFDLTSTGTKLADEQGNHLGDLEVTFRVRFPDGEAGDRAREMLPRAVERSHDRLCTVSRTVQLGAPVTMREE